MKESGASQGAGADASRPRKRGWAKFLVSVALHVAGGAALFAIKPGKKTDVLAIEMSDAKKPPKKAPPKDVPPPPPPPRPDREPAKRAPAPRAPDTPAPTQPVAAPAGGPRAFDLGLSNLPGGGGGGGLTLPADAPGSQPLPTSSATATAREVQKTLGGGPGSPTGDECTEPLVKPTPKGVPQPAYPEAARADGITGKVRVEVTVDASGTVVAARVLSGLGHGLDEAALGAARSARFAPGTRCGKPVTSTFVIGMRFAL